MCGIGEVENRESVKPKVAVIDRGIAAHVDYNLASLKLPVRIRQLAGGNAAVVYQIVIRAGLLDDLPREGEGRCRCQDHAVSPNAHPRRGCHIVKLAGFCGDVVIAMACLDVIVVWPAINTEMP